METIQRRKAVKTLVHVSKGCIQAATHRRDCHINEVESLTYYEVGEAEAFAWSLLDAVEVARGLERPESLAENKGV